MLPLTILLLVIGFVLLWTAFKGDGQGGYNPMALVGSSIGRS